MNKHVFALPVLWAATAMTTAYADAPREHGIINLQAEASQEIQNDLMQATLFLEQTQTNPTTLAKETNSIINQAMVYAQRYPQVKMTTGSQNTYPIYNDKQKLTGWRSRAEINLKSTDFKATSELIAQLQEQKLQLSNIQFSVSPEQRQNVENSLMAQASKAFQTRAQLLQNAWSAKSYELVEMSVNANQDAPQPYPMYARAAKMEMAADSVAPQAVEGGSSQIKVIASGSIQLK